MSGQRRRERDHQNAAQEVSDCTRPHKFGANAKFPKSIFARAIRRHLAERRLEVVFRKPFNAAKRMNGGDWPLHGETMIGIKRLENIRDSVRTVIEESIPGDCVETGVWRGGGSIMMKAALKAYGDERRNIWCADSFEGLPAPDNRYSQDDGADWHTYPELSVSLEQVQANFRKYDLLDDRIHFLKGWFKDTLPTAPIDQIAILRLDGDMYASTMDALNPLYDRVSSGGFIIVDDYGLIQDACKEAINDFRAARSITDQIIDIDGFGAYWRKS